MGSADTFITFTFVTGFSAIGAYAINLLGFKDWVDANVLRPVTAEPVPPTDGQPPAKEPTSGKTGTYSTFNAPLGKLFQYQGMWCWRNNKCGGGQVSVCGKVSCNPSRPNSECLVYRDWVARYACKPKVVAPPKPKPVGPCYGPCPLGKRPGVVGNACGCIACVGACSACYDRGLNCTCKLNNSKIIHKDANCAIGCNGYACWTNYPCVNRGAKAQTCVKAANCTTARAAWLKQWGCKSSMARAYFNNAYSRYGDQLEAMPTVA